MSIATNRPATNSKVWFLDYIQDAFLNTLPTLLQFITSFKQLPAWERDKKTVLKLLTDTNLCLHTILLPTVHSLKYAFFKDIDKALETRSSGFSLPSYILWTKVVRILRSQENSL